MSNGKYPEILLNNKWSPICGHFFWGNDYGATLFCQQLNSTYTSGIAIRRYNIPLASDGIRIGKCTDQDNSLSSCTDGCNDFPQLGGVCSNMANAKCGAGKKATVEVQCLECWDIAQNTEFQEFRDQIGFSPQMLNFLKVTLLYQ